MGKIQLTESFGRWDGWLGDCAKPEAGAIVNVDEPTAARLIEAGRAVPVEEKPKRRKAVRQPAESRADAVESQDAPSQ